MTPYKLKILNGVLKLKSFTDVVLNIFGIKDLGTQTGNVDNGLVDWSIQHLTKTTAQWNADTTTILLKGQLGIEDTGTTTFKLKVGDGISLWSQLGYISSGGGNQFPEHLYLTVVNKTGDNLLASGYKVMKVSDAQGQRLAVDYALADSNGNSTDTIGIVFENINNNQTGKLITVGEIIDINTTGSLQGQTWADGDVLYLDSTIPGNLTNIQPTAPNHLVVMGYVVYSHINQGKIYVKITNGFEIGELHNVYAPSPTNNDSIFWSSGTNRYENKSIATALGYTPENSANKGVANGYAPLASDGKVDAAYLPAYVDEVLEYANLAAFPATGASDKIYIALDTNKVYRWSGSVYIEVAANSGVWGAITGTITNQADLVNYVKGYTLSMNCTSAFNPSDNQVYFIGALQTNPFTTDFNLRLIVPKTGTIKSVVFSSRQTLGSSESSTIALGVNGSYANISTSIVFNGNPVNTALITGLSRNVNAGDYVTIRWTCPTWVTNPTNVFINCILYIE